MGKKKKLDNTKDQANAESSNAEDTELAIQALANVLQRHLLMFCYTTYAYRINPSVQKSPNDEPVEYIFEPDVPDYVGDDDDGEFLLESVNQRILLTHIHEAYSRFGKGDGRCPTQLVTQVQKDASGSLTRPRSDWIEIEGGTLPAWRPHDWALYYLERSTGAVINAICKLKSKRGHSGFMRRLIVLLLLDEAVHSWAKEYWEN